MRIMDLNRTINMLAASGKFIGEAVKAREGLTQEGFEKYEYVINIVWDRCPNVPKSGVWTSEQADTWIRVVAQAVLDYLEGTL